MSASRRFLPPLLLLVFAACGGGDGTSAPPGPDLTVVDRVVVMPAAPQLTWLGASVQLDARALNVQGAELNVTLTWSTSDALVAEVSPAGLVTAKGRGEATITAAAGQALGTATIRVSQTPTAIEKVGGDGQHGGAGAVLAQPLVVEVRDQGGSPVAGETLVWTVVSGAGSLESAAAETDAAGRAAATWRLGEAGAQTATAAAGPLTATFAATAVSTPFSVTGIEPEILVEGGEATLTGTGLTAGPATVTVGGIEAVILSAGATQIRFRVPVADCRPPRAVSVAVQLGGEEAALAASVRPAGVLALDVGQGVVFEPGGCIHLGEGPPGREYMLGVLSKAPVATLDPVRIQTMPGLTLAEAVPLGLEGALPLLAPAAGGAYPLATEADPAARAAPLELLEAASIREARAAAKDRIWEASRELLGRRSDLFDRRALAAQDVQAAVPEVGETLSLFAGGACSGRTAINGVVRHVGAHAIWVEDSSNPASGFTSSEWATLDATYSVHVLPTITDNFGAFADVDGNGRLIVLMTRAVNEMAGVLGYVFAGDLYSQSTCSQSNQAEIFYGIAPDPNGTVGNTYTKQQLLDLYPGLIAHEATHVLQFTHLRANKYRWEFEGGATLAEQLVGNRVYGHTSSSNLGYGAWSAGQVWYGDWVTDMALYWGWVGGSNRTSRAPEECSWSGTQQEGNTGPCLTTRAVYGVPSMLYRFLLDLHGPAHTGGEAGLMRALTASTAVGVQALSQHTGQPENVLLASFYSALWADGRIGDWMPSWNVHDVFEGVPEYARLFTYVDTGSTADRQVAVRGGSNAYLHWRPNGGHAPTAVRFRAPGGGILPTHTAFWILRVQ